MQTIAGIFQIFGLKVRIGTTQRGFRTPRELHNPEKPVEPSEQRTDLQLHGSEHARDIYMKLLGEDHLDVASTYKGLGDTFG